jgi:hypothetical protein
MGQQLSDRIYTVADGCRIGVLRRKSVVNAHEDGVQLIRDVRGPKSVVSRGTNRVPAVEVDDDWAVVLLLAAFGVSKRRAILQGCLRSVVGIWVAKLCLRVLGLSSIGQEAAQWTREAEKEDREMEGDLREHRHLSYRKWKSHVTETRTSPFIFLPRTTEREEGHSLAWAPERGMVHEQVPGSRIAYP